MPMRLLLPAGFLLLLGLAHGQDGDKQKEAREGPKIERATFGLG